MMKGNFTIFFSLLYSHHLEALGAQGGCWITIFQISKCTFAEHALTHTHTQPRTMQPVSHAGKTHASHRTEYAMQKEPESLSRMMMSNNVQVERRHLCLLPKHHVTAQCVCLAAWPCLTLCDSRDWSPQAPPSMGCFRQEYWSGLPLPPPGDLPWPRDQTAISCVSCVAGGFFYPLGHWGSAVTTLRLYIFGSGNLKIWENQHVSNENCRGLPWWSSG